MAKTDKNTEHLHKLHQQVTDAIEAMQSPEGWKRWLQIAAQLPQYSFNNQLLLMEQAKQREVKVRAFASYGKWKSLGYPVQKGELSYRIFGPVKRKIPHDPVTGKALSKKEAHGRKDVEWKLGVVGFTAVPTFEMSQTAAKDLAEIPADLMPQKIEGPAPDHLFENLVAFAQSHGVPVSETPLDSLGGANGVFIFSKDNSDEKEIKIGSELPPAQKVKTLIHEIAHMKLHTESDAPKQIKEIEAESTAFIVAAKYGLDTSDYSFNYIGLWSNFDAEMVRDTATNVIKVASEILDNIPNVATIEDSMQSFDEVDIGSIADQANYSLTESAPTLSHVLAGSISSVDHYRKTTATNSHHQSQALER